MKSSFKSLLHSNRLYYLTCDADFSSVPDADSAAYYEHEHTSLFVLTPRDITTNTHGNFVVDSLTFDFTDEDGEECTESWAGIDPMAYLFVKTWTK